MLSFRFDKSFTTLVIPLHPLSLAGLLRRCLHSFLYRFKIAMYQLRSLTHVEYHLLLVVRRSLAVYYTQ